MVALERVIEESNAKEQTGSVEVADYLFYAFCCTLAGLSLHSLTLHIYIAPFVQSY